MNKTFKLEIKEFGEQGSFTGLAAVYGTVDYQGDVIEPGAFTKTLADKGSEVPILWQHDLNEPIGLGTVADSADGLQIKGSLALESPVAQKAYALMKAGVIKGLSFGFDTVRREFEKGVRHLKEVKLWEVSLVTIGANNLAQIQGVKSLQEIALDDAKLTLSDFIEQEKTKFKALLEQYAAEIKAPIVPAAASQGKDAPEILHPSLDRIAEMLRS